MQDLVRCDYFRTSVYVEGTDIYNIVEATPCRLVRLPSICHTETCQIPVTALLWHARGLCVPTNSMIRCGYFS